MSYKVTVPSGRVLEVEGDTKHGLLTQSPDTGVTSAASAAGDIQIGVPFTVVVKCSGAGPNFSVFNKDAPWKFRVLKTWGIMSAAGGAADTYKLQHGDGAASESFNDITDAVDCNHGDKDLVGLVAGTSTIDDAYATVDEDESLRVVTASSAAVDVVIECIRVR